MRKRLFGMIAAAALCSTGAGAQGRPTLHVDTRWKQCSIVLDPSLTQSAWHKFTREAAQVVYFRPLDDAGPMGQGKVELSLMQWQTNVDDDTPAWNDTFVHPDSLHWLHDGSGLKFPGLAARAGVTSTTDLGVYFTKNPSANYGAYGLQLQQNLLRDAGGFDVAARVSFVSLFGPEDVDLKVYGVDLVTSFRPMKTIGGVAVVPYAGVATYLSSSRDTRTVAKLQNERVMGAMGTVGAAVQLSVLRVAAEASMAGIPSFALKVGIGSHH